MKFKINTVEVDFIPNQVLEFESHTLCKILDVEIKDGKLFINVLNRWGQEPTRMKKHKIILLDKTATVEYTVSYEPTLTRRGKIEHQGAQYYVFGVD